MSIEHGPTCALCGVVSTEEGDCGEPGCTGRVSWEATAEAYREQLAAARELGEELMQYQEGSGA